MQFLGYKHSCWPHGSKWNCAQIFAFSLLEKGNSKVQNTTLGLGLNLHTEASGSPIRENLYICPECLS